MCAVLREVSIGTERRVGLSGVTVERAPPSSLTRSIGCERRMSRRVLSHETSSWRSS